MKSIKVALSAASIILLALAFGSGCSEGDSPTQIVIQYGIDWGQTPPNFELADTTHYPITAFLIEMFSESVDSVKAIIRDDGGNFVADCHLYDDGSAFPQEDALSFCSPLSGDLVPNNTIFSRQINGQFASQEGIYQIHLQLYCFDEIRESMEITVIVAQNTPPVLSELFFPPDLPSGFSPVQIHLKAIDNDSLINDSVTTVEMIMYSLDLVELEVFPLLNLGADLYGMDLEPNLAVALPSDDYVFTFRAYDTFETVSSPLSVQVAMENHAPFLAESTLPDTVNLPTGADTTIFPITIRCWDDQTAEDIAWVKLQAQKPDDTWGSEIELFDDGNLALSGDELAGDSVFTRIVSILPTNLLGLYRFHLRAEDRAGNEIEVVDSLLVVP